MYFRSVRILIHCLQADPEYVDFTYNVLRILSIGVKCSRTEVLKWTHAFCTILETKLLLTVSSITIEVNRELYANICQHSFGFLWRRCFVSILARFLRHAKIPTFRDFSVGYLTVLSRYLSRRSYITAVCHFIQMCIALRILAPTQVHAIFSSSFFGFYQR